MNSAALILGVAVATAPAVEASEGAAAPAPLKLRSKSAVAAVMPAPRASAPFQVHLGQPHMDLGPRVDPRMASSRSSCSGQRSLCYDPQSGRIVYKPARALMPDIPGMQAENISVRRDRITLRYSF